MDYNREYLVIETPEKIKIRYAIASPLARFGAFIIDTIVYYLLIGLIALFLVLLLKTGDMAETVDMNLTWSLSLAFFFVLTFVFQWGYFVFFEMLFNGKSPGKMLLKLRVINYEGKFLDLESSVLRNFVRIVDINLTGFLGAIICMLVNRDMRRIGDLVGNTVVITEESFNIRLPDFSVRTIRQESYTDAKKLTKKLSEKELYIIRRFLNSVESFKEPKRSELAGKIAQSIKIKLNDSEGYNDPIDYLKSVYTRHKND